MSDDKGCQIVQEPDYRGSTLLAGDNAEVYLEPRCNSNIIFLQDLQPL